MVPGRRWIGRVRFFFVPGRLGFGEFRRYSWFRSVKVRIHASYTTAYCRISSSKGLYTTNGFENATKT